MRADTVHAVEAVLVDERLQPRAQPARHRAAQYRRRGVIDRGPVRQQHGDVAFEQEPAQLGGHVAVVGVQVQFVVTVDVPDAGEGRGHADVAHEQVHRRAHGRAGQQCQAERAVAGDVGAGTRGQAEAGRIAQCRHDIADQGQFLCGGDLAVRRVQQSRIDAGAAQARAHAETVLGRHLDQHRRQTDRTPPFPGHRCHGCRL
ncbi:Uncharacterised protein [Mycobacteroides abscessus subsp. abscessus]|nr:Uncharacterised protein [Mycobacteroides abscessus subsp. abscessus]